MSWSWLVSLASCSGGVLGFGGGGGGEGGRSSQSCDMWPIPLRVLQIISRHLW